MEGIFLLLNNRWLLEGLTYSACLIHSSNVFSHIWLLLVSRRTAVVSDVGELDLK